jgi:CheY-like chemotaxis protein
MSSLFVVDDNELDWRIANYNLKKYPVFDNVSHYDGGLPLINYIKDHINEESDLPDAIFLDLSMPGYDGWDVLDAIKAIYPRLAKKIKVYILSASISPVDMLRSKGYDFVLQFITKPFTKDKLFALS